MTTAYFLIVSSLSLGAAVWGWCLSIAASSDARIAREEAEAALDDVRTLAEEVDVLHRAVGPQLAPDPDDPVGLVPVDGTVDTTGDIEEVLRDCLEQPVVLVDRGWAPIHEWSTPLQVLGSVPPEDPAEQKTAPKHRKEA